MPNTPHDIPDVLRGAEMPHGAGWEPDPGGNFTAFGQWDGDGRNWQAELFHYLRLLLARRWLIAAVALLGLIVAAVRTFREPRLFVAQSTVEFKQAIPPGKDLDIMQRQLFIPGELAQRLMTGTK